MPAVLCPRQNEPHRDSGRHRVPGARVVAPFPCSRHPRARCVMVAEHILVIDVGTSSVRVAMVSPTGDITASIQTPTPPITPMPGLVECDADALGATVVDTATTLIDTHGAPAAVAITAQRATTVMWNTRTGRALAPALGWQDLRTIGECLSANAEHDAGVAPNQTATKAQWLLATVDHDPAHTRIGTIDAWLGACLGVEIPSTDPTHAAITGLTDVSATRWDPQRCHIFGIDPALLPPIVDTIGHRGAATALPGQPPIVASVGDQQASMAGQGCVSPGRVKITFGTGGMANVVTGEHGPEHMRRSAGGTFPIVTTSMAGSSMWGAEAVMLSAGSCVDWLRDDLGVIDTAADSDAIAAQCSSSDGVIFVPALMGLGTPRWDFGARGTLLGLTRGSERCHVVRAVLEGVAHRGADLVDALTADTGVAINEVRVDGGMSQNRTFITALARATGRPVLVSAHVEATALGAARLGQVALGQFDTVTELAEVASVAACVEPDCDAATTAGERERWRVAMDRSGEWIPELSALDF